VTARTLAAAALLAVIGTALAQPPKAKDDLKAVQPDPAKQLATRVSLDKFDGTFKEAIKLLADKFELSVVVDPRVGEDVAVGVAAQVAACNAADDRPVKLPKLVNVRLDTVVKLIAEQVGAKFLVYPDHVKIVPAAFAEYEAGVLTVNPDGVEEPLLSPADLVRSKPLIKRALVNASFKSKPLSEAIDEIAEATGATIAVSPLVPANIRQATITVRFANTPVEAAVRTLCEMTECGVIEDANVLLVTTRERAAARAKEEAQKVKDRQPQPFGGYGANGLLNNPLVGAVPPDIAGEIAKLKEQNEQLKKELEEIKKLLAAKKP
jgi:hypothetical protein